MSIQQPPAEWDDTIDLRKWIDALFRYQWLVLGCPVVAIAVAAIFGYIIQLMGSTSETRKVVGATLVALK